MESARDWVTVSQTQFMKFTPPALWLCLATLLLPTIPLRANTSLHTSWLWHLHQPNYWPDRRTGGDDQYENAWDTIQQQDAGRGHPTPENLRTIFGWGDRVAAYQGGLKGSLQTITGHANAGVQVSFSGALIENVQSLAGAGQLGYGGPWNNANAEARTWTTSGGKPRMDLVHFTYHHALAPFISDETLEMELRIHKRQMEIFWGTNPGVSRGYFPTETCFTERMIPVLKKVGIDWSIIANTHLARACPDMPIVTGSGGEMCDLPNRADQLNPPQGAGNYQRLQIDRGCSPVQVMPFGFQLHYARHVNPETGAESKIIVVPSDQVLGWKDSYSQWDLNLLNAIAARNDPAKPSLVLCAHDGDNAWSGGSSYYNEWVPNMAGQAASRGYEPTTVEQFIAEFSPDTNDVVHIEDGGWVYADGDMGSPMFINWHWPPSIVGSFPNVVDPSLGVSDKADNWRVIVATENRVKTAQQISGLTPDVDQVRDPWSYSGTPNGVELGWHYYLGGLDSGFVYYGCSGDMCQRTAISQSNAVRHVNSYLANLAADATPPTMFPPQRHPWNPGGTNFGVQYSYRVTVPTNSDFWVWTYAYDASGITNVTLNFRNNATNPPTSDQFQTFAGGALAGAWQTSPMTQRVVAPVTGVTPQYIADYYHAKVTGISNAFVDYYISAVDARGNTNKSAIFHVYVGQNLGGSGGGDTNGCNGRVCIAPVPPVQGSNVTVMYYPAGGPISTSTNIHIHLGWNNWASVVSPDPTMTFNAASNRWEFTTAAAAFATQMDVVFNNGSGAWDNNSGGDWHFAVQTNGVTPTPQAPPTPTGLTASPVGTNQINLTWTAASGATGYIVQRAGANIATTAATGFNDPGLTPATAYCYAITATNSAGNSAPTTSQCATTLAAPIGYPAFNMEGTPDFTNYLAAASGMTLYAALRGTRLYVATWTPGTNGPNDHFIFVTDQLLPTTNAAAPWAKSGKTAVATSKPFLAGESAGSYVGWFNAPAGSQAVKSPVNGAALEGTIDLLAAFGTLPANIYLCSAAYQTADGGALASSCPTNSGPDIGPNGFLCLPLLALRDHNADGKPDRLDPALDFALQNITAASSNFVVSWNAMPGRNYQLAYCDALTNGVWTDLPGAVTNAGALQTTLAYPLPRPATNAHRYYRVRLLP